MKRFACLLCLSVIIAVTLISQGPPAAAQSNVPGATTWYLAEGSTAVTPEGTFETWICVSNSGDKAATVSLTYMTTEGGVPGPAAVLPSGSAATFEVAQTVSNAWSVSTTVNSTEPVVAERQMFWDTGVAVTGQPFHQCGHCSIGTTEAATTWYLAEGSTGGNASGNFETWILVQNPGGGDATVDIDFQTPGGNVPGPQDVPLPSTSRLSFDVALYVPSQWSVSTTVTSDEPVIAERAVYWNTPHAKRQAAHDSIGVTTPDKTWYLAEGSTGINPGERFDAGNFETWILVQNPNDTTATLDIQYQTPTGIVYGPQDVALNPRSRRTFNVSDNVPDEWSVSTQVTASENVIAERSMYWNIPFAYYPGGVAVFGVPRWCGHDSIGVTVPDYNWEVANCRTDLAFESWILVQNPSDGDAYISIDYTTPEGIKKGPQNIKIVPGTRQSFRVNDTVQDVRNVGATVRNTGSKYVPVVVEHSTYWGPAQGEDPQNYRVCGFDTITFPWSKPL